MEKSIAFGEFKFKELIINYRVGTEDEEVLAHSFDNDIFYREIPFFKASNSPVIIDVGAHIGTFSILTAFKYPNARIYAIEACKETFDILKKNISLNKLDNIRPIHAAMSDKEGVLKLFHSLESGNWAHSITKKLSDSYEEVKALKLETLVRENKFNQIDLVKFNCEGAEFDILANCSPYILQKIRCAIILYHEDLNNNNIGAENLKQFLIDHKFNTKEIFKNLTLGRGWLISWNLNYYSNISIIKNKIVNRLKEWISH